MTIYIWGNASRYENYQRAVELAGDQVQFGGDPEDCAALLLPGGGDLEPWRYGQKNTASRGLEPERDAAELALMEYFTTLRRPVLGICRGLQTVNVFFGVLCVRIFRNTGPVTASTGGIVSGLPPRLCRNFAEKPAWSIAHITRRRIALGQDCRLSSGRMTAS